MGTQTKLVQSVCTSQSAYLSALRPLTEPLKCSMLKWMRLLRASESDNFKLELLQRSPLEFDKPMGTQTELVQSALMCLH